MEVVLYRPYHRTVLDDPYNSRMTPRDTDWRAWPGRFRAHLQSSGKTLAQVAELLTPD